MSLGGALSNLLGGSPLHGLTNMLGITHGIPMPNTNVGNVPGFFDGSALLGPSQSGGELPPVGSAPAPASQPADPNDIVVPGHINKMSPQTLGLPSLPAMQNPDPNTAPDQRATLQTMQNMAREQYHHGSEFGTHGILRDVIGNVEDFGRRLLGFAPRYNDEKWSEKAYGMTSSDPQVAAAAREAAMQYNPEKTQAYGKELEGEQAQKIQSEATSEFKKSQAQYRYAGMIGGLAGGLVHANAGQTPDVQATNYNRAKPALQNALDQVYGKDADGNSVYKLPDNYDEATVGGLTQAGFNGTNTQRYQSNMLDNNTRIQVANGRNLTAIEVAKIGADARRYAADANYRASINRQVIAGQPIETTETTTPSGSIIAPVITKHKTIVRSAPSGGSAPAPQGQPQRKFYQGHWYTRGPNGEAIRAD